MRKHFAIPFLMFFMACEGSSNVQTKTQTNQQSLVCSGSDVPIYRNRFAPQAGASGVATPAEAAAGVISSDAVGGAGSAPTSGAIAVDVAFTTATPSTTPVDGAPTGTGGTAGGAGGSNAPVAAMDASCGQAPCSQDQVAVELPPVVAGATGGTPTPGVGAAASLSDPPVSTGPTATTSALTAPPSVPTGTLVCADPPPSCPEGQSPQFTSKKTWECTDCSLVVTYGGIYGNYRRCVNMPHLNCSTGEVPTWVFENEQWECKTKCDNGQYDQHTVQGVMVCVPC